MSQWAELHPLPGEAKAFAPPAEPAPARARLTLEPTRAQFGLRVLV